VDLSRIVASVALVVALATGGAGDRSAPANRPALCTHTHVAHGASAVWVTPCAPART
jgi:hypothetical protein